MKKLLKLIKEARFVFVCGNGGSSATAEHFSNDLFSKGVRAICLNSNTSIMTMLANDYGYKEVFSLQLKRLATKDDLLITISASGTSPNILKALSMAKQIGMSAFAFETFKKGSRDYGKIEVKHVKFAHEVAAKI